MIKDKDECLSNYEVLETLGSGAFSEVKKARDKTTGMEVAIKVIEKSKCVGKEGMIKSEVSILKSVHHPNIISLIEMFETATRLYLVMELVTGGELFDSIIQRGHYSEKESAQLAKTMLEAAEYLHSMGIAHRDLKPENLMFSAPGHEGKLMIGDFGLSKIFNDEEVMKTACGTPGYVAPEVLKREGYGCEVDLWSIGVITYILISGYPPFYDENNAELFKAIMKGYFVFDSPAWDNVSKDAKDFISALLVVNPKKRMTAHHALRHSFITKNCDENTSEQQLQQSSYLLARDSNAFSLNEVKTELEMAQTIVDPLERQGTVIEPSSEKSPQSEGISVPKPVDLLTETVPQKSFQFLSLNVFMRPPLIRTNKSDFKDLRLKYFIDNFLTSYDVIAFQELFEYGSPRHKKLMVAAHAAGFKYTLSAPSGGIFQGVIDGGISIISRFPIEAEKWSAYPRGIYSDRLVAKGVLYAKLKLTQTQYIHLFTTHLQSTPTATSDPTDVYAQRRQKQILQLKSIIDEQISAHGNFPMLIMGDMNVNARFSASQTELHSEEYMQTMKILRGEPVDIPPTESNADLSRIRGTIPHVRMMGLQDLLLEKYNFHPATFGVSASKVSSPDGTVTDIPQETTLTSKDFLESNQSLDWILFSAGGSDKIKVDFGKTECLAMLTKDLESCTHISDHFGITTNIVCLD